MLKLEECRPILITLLNDVIGRFQTVPGMFQKIEYMICGKARSSTMR